VPSARFSGKIEQMGDVIPISRHAMAPRYALQMDRPTALALRSGLVAAVTTAVFSDGDLLRRLGASMMTGAVVGLSIYQWLRRAS
jgi:hypothetical protein